jgi:phage tail sheath gpL-like
MANPASIVLTGLSANYPIPGVYEEINFAQGPVSGAPGPRLALVLGNKTTAGSATNPSGNVDALVFGPDTQTPVQTEADFIQYFGAGSQLHRFFLRFTAVNRVTPLYVVCVTESVGAAAASTVVVTTTAANNGNARVWILDQFVDTPITNGDSAIVIAGNIASNINTQTRWPVTAANSGTSTVTITAKNKGPEGNWLNVQAQITSGGSSILTTITPTAITKFTSGTTADVNTNALATINPARYYYIGSCDSDATNLGRLVTQVNNQALPTTGIRQRAFGGSVDTLANTITTATGLNAARAELIWGQATDLTPLELTANNMAIYSLYENSGGRPGPSLNNYDSFPISSTQATSWQIKGTRAGPSAGPTNTNLASALNNGITPIALTASGAAYLVSRITTRSLNGAVQDYRTRDAQKVSVPDYFADDLQAVLQLQFGGKDLLPDPVQGQLPVGGGPNAIPNQATTPSRVGDAAKNLVDVYGNAGQLQNPATIKANMIVQRETNPTTRVSMKIGLQVVDVLHQIAVSIDQVA